MKRFVPIPYAFERLPEAEMEARAAAFLATVRGRRSCRDFAPTPIPKAVLAACLAAAGCAPSGANKQPWRFVVVGDAALKRRIREAAEAEEKRSYEARMPDAWRDDLEPLGTDWQKPFLEAAPYLVVVFRIDYAIEGDQKRKHYYVSESVGLAAGFFLAACQHAGLATLTHTPSPMRFLGELLDRPPNERPFLVIPVGYPADGCSVPALTKKTPGEYVIWRDAASGAAGTAGDR